MAKDSLFIWQTKPINISIPEVCKSVKRDLLYGKRDLFIWQKRPISIRVPEVCVSGKRDLLYDKRGPLRLAYLGYAIVCGSVKRGL